MLLHECVMHVFTERECASVTLEKAVRAAGAPSCQLPLFSTTHAAWTAAPACADERSSRLFGYRWGWELIKMFLTDGAIHYRSFQ